MPHQDRLNIAVFIDFDNIEIGVKTTLNQQFDVAVVLDAIKERGEVVTKIAYADWTRSGEYSRSLTQHAIRLVQRNMTPGGDKNGADINLALDALEMAFTHQHINAYVIVGGDSDFLSLVEKLKQYDKKVFVVGGRAFTSMILQRNCHEFIAYENLAGVRKAAIKTGRPMPAAAASSPIAQAFAIVRRALKILADREVTPQTGLLKSTLLQLDSTFSERNYGASSFLDFVEKLAQTGFVHLKTSGRSVIVELNEAFVDDAEGSGTKTRTISEGEPDEAQAAPAGASHTSAPPPQVAQGFRHGPDHDRSAEPAGPPQGDQADGVREAGRILSAAKGARWPMYLRNVKQILRQTEGGFDERRYGFGGLMDLLKGCQREGFVRIERDRRGGLRVFHGPALQAHAASQSALTGLPQEEPAELSEASPVDAEPGQWIEVGNRARETADLRDIEQPDAEPIPIDTTAELLGRAKHRKPRTRALRPVAAPAPRAAARAAQPKGTPKKAAAPRRSTRKKATASDASDEQKS